MPRPFYSWEKSPWYPFSRRLGGPQSRSGRGVEEKNSQPPPGIEPRSSDRPARSQSDSGCLQNMQLLNATARAVADYWRSMKQLHLFVVLRCMVRSVLFKQPHRTQQRYRSRLQFGVSRFASQPDIGYHERDFMRFSSVSPDVYTEIGHDCIFPNPLFSSHPTLYNLCSLNSLKYAKNQSINQLHGDRAVWLFYAVYSVFQAVWAPRFVKLVILTSLKRHEMLKNKNVLSAEVTGVRSAERLWGSLFSTQEQNRINTEVTARPHDTLFPNSCTT